MSNIILQKKIQNRTELLLAFANARKAEGKTDLVEFVMNRGSRVVKKCISTAWEMEKASEMLERSKLTRIQSCKNVCKTIAVLSVTVVGRNALNSYLCGTTYQLKCLKSSTTGEGKILQHSNQGPCKYRQDIFT